MHLSLHTPKCGKCMVGRILRHRDPATPLVNSGCTQDGFFRIPLADGDGLAPDNSGIPLTPDGHGEHCTLCGKHFALYQQHIRQSTCQSADCFRVCLPYQTPEGTKYECVEHGKERIILDQMPISLRKKPIRKTEIVPVPMSPPDSPPPMHPMGEIPAPTPRRNPVSNSSERLPPGNR